jgi:NH3-dependent NAD+ synthetase
VVLAPPTAELRPITAEYTQTDEEDMGMSYAELGDFGRLRKIERCVRAVWLCPPVLCTPLSCRLENAVQLGAGTNPSLLFSARILRITSHLRIRRIRRIRASHLRIRRDVIDRARMAGAGVDVPATATRVERASR